MQPLSRGRGTGSRSCRFSTHDLWLDENFKYPLIFDFLLSLIFWQQGNGGASRSDRSFMIEILRGEDVLVWL